nr:hypothetical protein [Tanacetum cinerariifolium]
NTLTYEAKTRAYSFQLDETRYVLDANLLREALEITPIDQAHHFVLPPSGDAIMDFVNELGYTEVGKKKPETAKQLKSKPIKEKSSKPTPALKPKVTHAKLAKPSPVKHLKLGKDDTFANLIRESSPPMDAETSTDADMTHSGGDTEILMFGKEQG